MAAEQSRALAELGIELDLTGGIPLGPSVFDNNEAVPQADDVAG